jgi:membrane associated rhomboid family serine protease
VTARGTEPEPATGAEPAGPGAGDATPGESGAAGRAGGLPPGHPGWVTPSQQQREPMSWGAPQNERAPGQVPPPGMGAGPDGPPVPAGTGQQSRCYRHPEREAYVVCQRCGRPICPDCMRPAAVGFHCPEEDGARRPEPRTSLGGRAQTSPGLVTKLLIVICVVAYLLEGVPGLTGTSRVNRFTFDYSLIGIKIATDDQYYRLVTAAFLHGSILHIALNMYALFLLGTQLEAVLGRARYLALFFGCAIGGNTLSYLMSGDQTFSYGASTAIFGFFAAYYLIARRLRLNTNQILVVVGINLAITFTISGIDKWGHLGGLGTGLLLGLLYAYVPPRRAVLQAAGTIAVVGLLVAAAVLNSQSLTSITTG